MSADDLGMSEAYSGYIVTVCANCTVHVGDSGICPKCWEDPTDKCGQPS